MVFMQSKCSLYSSLLLILEERLSLNVLVISSILCLCFDGFLCYHCSMNKTQGDGEFSGFNEFLCDAMTKRHYFPQFSVSTDRLDYY